MKRDTASKLRSLLADDERAEKEEFEKYKEMEQREAERKEEERREIQRKEEEEREKKRELERREAERKSKQEAILRERMKKESYQVQSFVPEGEKKFKINSEGVVKPKRHKRGEGVVSKYITIRMPEDEYNNFVETAERHDLTFSQLFRILANNCEWHGRKSCNRLNSSFFCNIIYIIW